MSTWTLLARDQDLNHIGELGRWTKLDLYSRFNLTGSWVLDLATADAGLLSEAGGVILLRDGTTVMSGPITNLNRVWSADGDQLTVSGVSDDVHLDDRIAYPSPFPFTADDYDVRTGAAETVIRGYVDANLGAGADVDRRLDGLVLADDEGRGTTVTGRARLEMLSDLLRSLALAGGDLGFRLVQSGLALEFSVYVPRDLTTTAIFSSGIGNLATFSTAETVSKANAVICGGGGEGTDRVFRSGTDDAAIARWGRRIEEFRDRRDTTDTDELDQTVAEELANNAQIAALALTPTDTAHLAFLTDYGLGDTVTVEVDGIRTSDVIREVHITVDAGGEVVVPTVGTPGTGQIFSLLDTVRSRLKSLRVSVGNLERR